MRTYSECLSEARNISTNISLDQAIQIANGMYMAETTGGYIKNFLDDVMRDRQGYKGLQTLIHEATDLCKRLGR